MTTNDLLTALSRIDHDARMHELVEIGRRAAADAAVAAAVDDLERYGSFGRALRLQACAGSRDCSRVVAALDDPSQRVRGLAVRLVPMVCDDDGVARALGAADRHLRLALLRGLHRRRRFAPIDHFLDQLAERGDDQLRKQLHLGTDAAVERHFTLVEERFDTIDWRRLAALHPSFTAQELLRRALAATALDRRLLAQANAVLGRLAETAPDDAVALVRALLRYASPSDLALRPLAERRPAQIADLIETTADRVQISLGAQAARLPQQRLIELLDRRPHLLADLPGHFRLLPPASRAAVYTHAARGWRSADGVLAHHLVALLPPAERLAEGRRHLALPALATRPEQRLQYASFLPWDEALRVLGAYLGDPDPQLRAAAWGAIAFGVRYQRSHAADLLALARTRRNEQDPVRAAILSGLADLPPSTWPVAQLDALGSVIRDALDAQDLSPSTGAFAERLVIRLIPFRPAWAAGWLATLARERGILSPGLGDRLSDEDVRRIAPALLPVFRAWDSREREPQLVAAAASLGRRLRAFPELVELLERVLQDTLAPRTADSILTLFARYQPQRLRSLVPALLRADDTWITRPVVYTWLHRHRQDLLTRYLGRSAYRGRFGTGRTRFVLPLASGFFRWLPDQQQAFAGTLEEVTRDAERDTPAALRAIAALAGLPDASPEILIALARDGRPALQEAALRVLGRLDAGQGIQPLIEALDDERARIAVYALRRALLAMPPDRALGVLRAAPLARVTVAKEVVRLLGELRSDAAYAELLAIERRDLHRDVRVALLRALWDHLDRDTTWPVLEAAAVSADPAIARGVTRIAADGLTDAARRRLLQLLATLLAHPEPRVRLDVLGRFSTMPVRDEGQMLVGRLLALWDTPAPDERSAAVRAAFAIVTEGDAALVATEVERLLPNRRSLLTVTEGLRGVAPVYRARLLPLVRSVLDALAADPLTAAPRVALACVALPPVEAAAYVSGMAAEDVLHDDALQAAAGALQQAAWFADPAEAQQGEAALAGSADPRLRRLALAALIGRARRPRGWDDAHLAQLRIYRADPSPLVAAAAQFTLPAAELS